MRKYRIFKGSDGTGEEGKPNEGGSEGAKTTQTPQAVQATGPTEAEKLLTTKIAGLEKRGKEMEDLLLDESYTEFLAGKKTVDTKDADALVDEMTNAELVNHLTKKLGEKIDAGLNRLENNTAVTKAEAEVKELRGKHTDFDLYKPEMLEIAKTNPNLSIKRLYNMAKAEVGPRKPTIGSGSLPTNEIPGKSDITPKNSKEQADIAWKKSGIDKFL